MTEHMPEHDPSYGIPDIAEPAELDADELKRVLEALLLVIDTPVSTSVGLRPASANASNTASAASRSSLRPEFFEKSVAPIPTMAA